MPNASRKRRTTDLSSSRKTAFLIFTLLFPLLFFFFTEATLRIVGYGPNLDLFRTEEVSRRQFLNMNPGVKSRYFSRVEFNPMTSMDFFEERKPEGTFRIFCLGGSTTAGYPYGYVGSFSTFLKQRLSRLFPERRIEIINLGLTATNSFTALDMARELGAYDPDLIIVYDGHNEFYGALGLASRESAGGSRWMTQLYLRLVHVRTFLLLRDLYAAVLPLLNPMADETGGTMMERLARGQTVEFRDDLYNATLDAFEANVAALLETCNDGSIPVIISSQVSNLRNLEPFISGGMALPEAVRIRFQSLYRTGLEQLVQGDADSAALVLTEACSLDTLAADAAFALARAYDASGRTGEAFTWYTRARDLDELRFRQSSDFNEAARRLTDLYGQIFVDIEQEFRAASPDFIPGNELILEHLHPNSYGYFLMARAYANAIRRSGLLAPEAEWSQRDTLNEQQLWNDRWMTSLDERAGLRRTEILTSSWPFRTAAVPAPPPAKDDRLGDIIDKMLDGTLAWEQAHVAAADYYEALGALDRTAAEYQALIAMTPMNVSPYLRLARIFLKQLAYEPARTVLMQSLEVEPTAYAYRALAAIAVDTGTPANAVSFLESAISIGGSAQEITECHFMLALALGKTGDSERAAEQLRIVLSRDPGNDRARRMLRQLTEGN